MTGTDQERRLYARYRCGGDAEIFGLSSGISSRGSIKNLSLGGCLLCLGDRTRKLKPIHGFGRSDLVEMTFCVRQMPFRVQGRVRQINPDQSIGVEFTLQSERGKRQLRELIAELGEGMKYQRRRLHLAQES